MSKQISPLRQRMTDDMNMRNMSPSTINSYNSAVSRFAAYFDRSPDVSAPPAIPSSERNALKG